MQKNVFYLIVLLLVLFAASGCSETTSSGSYQGILMLHDQHYIYRGGMEGGEYTLGGKIAEVHRKVAAGTMPGENFSSNYLEPGDEIHFAKEDNAVILVKRKNGDIDMFRNNGNQE